MRATGVSADLSRGSIDRPRTLPMSPSAALAGRVLANTSKSAVASC